MVINLGLDVLQVFQKEYALIRSVNESCWTQIVDANIAFLRGKIAKGGGIMFCYQ